MNPCVFLVAVPGMEKLGLHLVCEFLFVGLLGQRRRSGENEDQEESCYFGHSFREISHPRIAQITQTGKKKQGRQAGADITHVPKELRMFSLGGGLVQIAKRGAQRCRNTRDRK